jgi:hypothetical protein
MCKRRFAYRFDLAGNFSAQLGDGARDRSASRFVPANAAPRNFVALILTDCAAMQHK